MARRRHHHEEHTNHEAWAIPYGDLVTLLLAFFVVMYAVSSVNEGKYRVMADAMSTAFGGPPRTMSPVQLGETQQRGSTFDQPSISVSGAQSGSSAATPVQSLRMRQPIDVPAMSGTQRSAGTPAAAARDRNADQLGALGARVERALAPLVDKGLVTVRRSRTYIEVEIQSDLLFASGSAVPSAMARQTIAELAELLRAEPNAIRVEGYTDNVPIRTAQFRSNWELSAARAASVVHVFSGAGVAEPRLAVVGYGEHQPVADNATPIGRNANRRVQLVILAAPQAVDTVPAPRTAPAPAPAANTALVAARTATPRDATPAIERRNDAAPITLAGTGATATSVGGH